VGKDMSFLIASFLQLFGTGSDWLSFFVYIILSLALLLGIGYLVYQVIRSFVRNAVREEMAKQQESPEKNKS
jgi:hypothetical protein